MNVSIRTATGEDAAFVHDVYGYYVENTNVTFSTENPDVESYRQKILHTLETYPFYICEADGKPCGFAYGSQIRPHEAYRWGVEATVYLAPDAPKRTGLGSTLYTRLIDTLTQQGFMTVYGVITEQNEPSLALHRAMGFTMAGQFDRMGYKNGQWLGVIWMRKEIGHFSDTPSEPVLFRLLDAGE
ncbi:MAG: N-acetyltransferase family protein [Eubacteriales bacterium]|nr:N-acetyltransferase family protein [Eubacteriales bacterium]